MTKAKSKQLQAFLHSEDYNGVDENSFHISYLIQKLEEFGYPRVVDESDLLNQFDFNMRFDCLKDLSLVEKQLSKYGIGIKKEVRVLDIINITDK